MSETIISRFFANADRYGSRPMFWFPDGEHWVVMGWRTAAQLVRDFASALIELGHQKGDTMAILADTRREWTTADFGNLAAGGVTVGVYSTMTAEQARYLVAHSDAAFLVVDTKEQYDKVQSVRSELPRLRKVIVMDPTGLDQSEDWTSFSEFLQIGRRARHDVDARVSRLTHQDAATFVYTSGTTGPPKGAMLTHGNVTAALTMFEAVHVLEEDVGFTFLPLAHILQRGVTYYGVWTGTPGAFAQSIATVADDLQEIRPTLVAAVPRIFEKIYNKIHEQVEQGTDGKKKIFNWAKKVGREVTRLRQANEPIPRPLELQYNAAKAIVFDKIRAKLGGRIRVFLTGGAPIAKEILEFFDAADIMILEGWGMSETVAAGTMNLPGAQRFGSIGRPLAGVEIRLDDDGEILIRGPNIFSGYYKDEDATRSSFTKDGYFRTGDIGRVDAEGYYSIVDRKKDILITAAGKNVAPQNIENLVKSDPVISQVVVLGDREPYLVALVSATPEAQEQYPDADLRARIQKTIDEKNEQLASYERIRKWRMLPQELTQEAGEVTPTMKVKRKVVLEKYGHMVKEMYAEPKREEQRPQAR